MPRERKEKNEVNAPVSVVLHPDAQAAKEKLDKWSCRVSEMRMKVDKTTEALSMLHDHKKDQRRLLATVVIDVRQCVANKPTDPPPVRAKGRSKSVSSVDHAVEEQRARIDAALKIFYLSPEDMDQASFGGKKRKGRKPSVNDGDDSTVSAPTVATELTEEMEKQIIVLRGQRLECEARISELEASQTVVSDRHACLSKALTVAEYSAAAARCALATAERNARRAASNECSPAVSGRTRVSIAPTRPLGLRTPTPRRPSSQIIKR